MALHPNRISAFQPLTPRRELALARELLEVQSEEELDHFLPLLAAAVPMLTSIAGPLLKNVAGSLFGGGGSGKRKRPRDQQEQFLGGIVKGLLGGELESEQQERFLGGIIGKLFGGGELEAENHVQEQFLGGIVKGLLGGELESETGAAGGQPRMLRRARRFVRLVSAASGHAAGQLANLQRLGHRPSPAELRRIVLASIVQAARQFAPRLAAVAFPGGAPAPAPSPVGPGAAPDPGHGQSVLELMIADATPLGAPPNGRTHRTNGYPLG